MLQIIPAGITREHVLRTLSDLDEADDAERMLEVKATGLGKFFPFFVTSNEVRCSEDIPEQYQLFRVFDFGRSPRLYILHGSLRELCQLEPVLYRAVI